MFRALTRALGMVFLSLLLLHVTPVAPWVIHWLMTNQWDAPVAGDTLIVLGAEQQSDGLPGISSYWRTAYAVRAWREGKCARVVFSGGPSKPGLPSLASEMAAMARGLGVPVEAIAIEDRSHSTRENALYVTELVRDWPGGKILMTSDIHIRRAQAAFARAGLRTRVAPALDVAKRWNGWVGRWECLNAIFWELIKLGYYTVRSWV